MMSPSRHLNLTRQMTCAAWISLSSGGTSEGARRLGQVGPLADLRRAGPLSSLGLRQFGDEHRQALLYLLSPRLRRLSPACVLTPRFRRVPSTPRLSRSRRCRQSMPTDEDEGAEISAPSVVSSRPRPALSSKRFGSSPLPILLTRSDDEDDVWSAEVASRIQDVARVLVSHDVDLRAWVSVRNASLSVAQLLSRRTVASSRRCSSKVLGGDLTLHLRSQLERPTR